MHNMHNAHTTDRQHSRLLWLEAVQLSATYSKNLNCFCFILFCVYNIQTLRYTIYRPPSKRSISRGFCYYIFIRMDCNVWYIQEAGQLPSITSVNRQCLIPCDIRQLKPSMMWYDIVSVDADIHTLYNAGLSGPLNAIYTGLSGQWANNLPREAQKFQRHKDSTILMDELMEIFYIWGTLHTSLFASSGILGVNIVIIEVLISSALNVQVMVECIKLGRKDNKYICIIPTQTIARFIFCYRRINNIILCDRWWHDILCVPQYLFQTEPNHCAIHTSTSSVAILRYVTEEVLSWLCSSKLRWTMRLVYVLAILLIVASVKSFDRLLVPSVTISSDNLMGNATVQIFSALSQRICNANDDG